jgi:uncharacterized membrane protein (UPF0182 family)
LKKFAGPKLKWLLAGIVALVFLLSFFSFYYLDWLWFKSIAFGEIFTTIWSSRVFLGLVAGAITLLILGGNLYVVMRQIPEPEPEPDDWDEDGGPRNIFVDFLGLRGVIVSLGSPWARFVIKSIAVLVAFMVGVMVSDNWMIIQQFLHRTPFGTVDPIFGHDLSFYFFTYPFLQLICQLLLQTFIIAMIAVGVLYLLTNGSELLNRNWRRFSFSKRHLCILLACIFLFKALDYALDAYSILFSEGTLIYGAGYTDVHARLLGYRILMAISALMALVIIVNTFINRLHWIVYGAIVWVGCAMVLTVAYPVVVQKLIVQPNEFNKETIYLEHAIEFTQKAYKLDTIDHREFAIDYELSAQDLANNQTTVDNIRLWDWEPLLDTYKSLQELRLYYVFHDVDIDRYTIDGEYRQVMLSAREMEDMARNQALSPEAKNWVNERLTYTHGYGVAMSPVNAIAQEGFPEFFIKDIPPQFSTDLTLTRPELYFGERTDSYVIVNTQQPEFDYPMGEQNVVALYQGENGLQVHSFFRRLVLAWELNDYKLLFSGEVTNESQVLLHRNIMTRINRLAPYLYLDEDPYIVVRDNGELSWIVDGYTYSNRFPYSQPFDAAGHNYLRNAVKIVVNAYSGLADFYIVDPDDPMIMTYADIFKGMYQPMADMPADIKAHLRYPEFIFEVQAGVYSTFHMSDPWVFYNKEDSWIIPSEILGNKETRMDPYYLITKLPKEEQEEYIIMLPFTPNSRPNLNAWMCARMDGDNYGKIIEYRFPKQETVFGPMQIESRINQNTQISQELTLWSQGGSSVYRGNVLIIPVENSLLYIEPLYLQADQSKMPELKRVIVSYGNNLVMETSLEAALVKLFGADPGAGPTGTTAEVTPRPVGDQSVNALIDQALQYYNQADSAMRQGNWQQYGEALQRLEETLLDLQQSGAV